MTSPPIRYLVASPSGDVPVDEGKLDYPLEGDPSKTSYRTYFQAITDFLRGMPLPQVVHALREHMGVDLHPANLVEIIVRSEKHGALSHPASIELVARDGRIKLGLHVAVTAEGKNSVHKEFDLLTLLHRRFGYPYVPRPLYVDERHSMAFLLEEWFDDFHEFHTAKTADNEQRLKLWDYVRGERFLNSEQAFEIYRRAAEILTLYYDLGNFTMIYPWHHAAGDFVAKIEDSPHSPASPLRKDAPFRDLSGRGSALKAPSLGTGDKSGLSEGVQVRLTTVRGYEPFMGFDEDDVVSPILPLYYFLLHLTIQMRLDKIDGLGETVWAEEFSADATVKGFFEALGRRHDATMHMDSVRSFKELLRSFSREELLKTSRLIAEQLRPTTDYRTIEEHLEEHAARLYLTFQNFPK